MRLRNPRRPLLNNGSHGGFLAQPRPGLKRVPDMKFKRIFTAGYGCNPALGIVCVRFSPVLLGDDGHAAARRQLQPGKKTGDAAAQNQVIELMHNLATVQWQRPGFWPSEPPIINQPRLPHKNGQGHVRPGATLATGANVAGSKNST